MVLKPEPSRSRRSARGARETPTAEPKENVLLKIAAEMKALALERAQDPDPAVRTRPVTHVLSQGARLALYLTRSGAGADVWRLRISRPGVFPSENEMDTFRRDFGVGFPCIQENVKYTVTFEGVETEMQGYVLQWSLKSDRSNAVAPARGVTAPAIAEREAVP